MQSRFYVGLTVRYILHLAAVGSFLSILLVWNASREQRRTVLLEMEQKATLMGESLGTACSLRYFLGDVEAIQYIFSRSISIPDVVSIALTDRNGKEEVKVGDSIPLSKPAKALSPRKLNVWEDGKYMYVRVPLVVERQAPESITDMLSESAPEPSGTVRSDLLGHIYVTLSLDRSRHLVQSLILRSFIATLLIIILGSALAFIFFRRAILSPIRRLIQAMKEVEEGGLRTTLQDIDPSDEIGDLTRAFNNMTRNLQRAEDGLRRANSELEERVKERTKNLEDAVHQLKETQEKALRSEKLAAIGQLASGVGHELRNPLGAIRNAIYYIRDAVKEQKMAEKDPALIEFLDLADSEIKSSTNIISDLLDFARVGKLFVQPTNVNEMITALRAVLDVPANVQLLQELAPELPTLSIDPQRMKQVFINLASNAIQAMGDGGKLTIRTYLQPDGAGQRNVMIEFRDTGSGIKPENLKKIFEPLFTTKAKGTGLGLAICQGIVESHSGKILVESEEGKGTVFTVRLPAPKQI